MIVRFRSGNMTETRPVHEKLDLYSPRNDTDPEMIPISLHVDPEMIPN